MTGDMDWDALVCKACGVVAQRFQENMTIDTESDWQAPGAIGRTDPILHRRSLVKWTCLQCEESNEQLVEGAPLP